MYAIYGMKVHNVATGILVYAYTMTVVYNFMQIYINADNLREVEQRNKCKS